MSAYTVKMVLVTALAISLGGCIKEVRVTPEQANLSHKQTIKSVEIPVAITGAELISGQVMSFGPPTALYSGREQRLIGIDSIGDSVAAPWDSVEFVFVRRIDRAPNESYRMRAASFLNATVGRRSTACDKVVYPMSERVDFDPAGGVFDTSTQKITGRSLGGSEVHARLDAISFVRTERFSLFGSTATQCSDCKSPSPRRNPFNDLGHVPPEKANLYHSRSVESIEIPVAIVGAKLKSGRELVFRPPTGSYSSKKRLLIGCDSTGDSVSLSFNRVNVIYLRRIDKPLSGGYAMPPDLFLSPVIEKRPTVLGGVVYPVRERVEFNPCGGVYDTLYEDIAGWSKDNSVVHARLDQISGVGVRKFNVGTTICTVAAVAGITAIIVAFVRQLRWDLDWSSKKTY